MSSRKPNTCAECAHLKTELVKVSAWDFLPPEEIFYCEARPGIEGLKQFPFHATYCEGFRERK